MSLASLLTSPNQDRFLQRLAIVDRLRAVASGDIADGDLADDLGLSPAAASYLKSSEGVTLVGKWLLAFSSSLAALDEFRSAEFRSTRRRHPSEEDLRKVASASGDILDALKERLEQRAAGRC